ncbi:p94 [Mamestra configurata nucleopolyhedrovirus A]|uniref:P94 n=1 Tax=Mamestra configurata nucleopolyhedrovirus TaxID=207830 RepID=Q8QLA8_NPVMC|nr:p94 [Mamestra configurata nucleopolyhedrovirus A]AAM09234.1 p94 [Mamestra configurata nucleopolyhedrovirus A]
MEFFKQLFKSGASAAVDPANANDGADYFVYATDDSGSTTDTSYYNDKAPETLTKFENEVAQFNSKNAVVKYLHWGSTCREQSREQVLQRYENNKYAECGGTSPETIIDWIQTKMVTESWTNLRLLYIITDGQISSNKVWTCKQYMKRYPFVFDRVVFHAISADINYVDLSVASTFLGKSDCSILYNMSLVEQINLAEPYDYEAVTPENFEEKTQEMLSYIKLQFLNTKSTDAAVLQEIEKLKKMRNRLLMHDKLKMDMSSIFETKNRATFVAAFKDSNYYNTFVNTYSFMSQVDKVVCTMINYLHNDHKSYSFDALRVKQYCNTVGSVSEEDVDQVSYENAQIIEFPDCILDDESGVPAILLTHCNLLADINDTVTLTKFKKNIEFPLHYMSNKDVKESIEYFYNVNTLKSLLEHDVTISPRSRKPFTGALVPSAEFDAYNDYVLLSTYFNGKRVPVNKGLMYYVLYKHMINAEYINSDVCEYFRKYVLHRISKTLCPISFTLQPLEPQMMVSLPAALWYCVDISTELFANDPLHFGKERLREYAYYANDMITMLKWCSYTLDEEAIKTRADILLTINALKRIQQYSNKLQFIFKLIFKEEQGFFLNVIKNKKHIYKLNLLDVGHNQMVDNKKLERAVDLNEFAYFYNKTANVALNSSVIDLRTMRPRFVCADNVSFYEDLLKLSCNVSADNNYNIQIEPATKLNLHKTVSLYKMYINFVNEYQRYPSLSDYQEFVCERYRVRDNKIGVFNTNIINNITAVYFEYSTPTTNMSVDEFLMKTKMSVNREQRIVVETDNTWNTYDIKQFITEAEQRVGLMC